MALLHNRSLFRHFTALSCQWTPSTIKTFRAHAHGYRHLLLKRVTISSSFHHRGASVDSNKNSPKKRAICKPYLQLAKSRLTGLVMVTSGAGYMLALPSLSSSLSSVSAVMAVMAGTGLVSASANAINQLMERRFDALMARTAARPLITGAVSTGRAVAFSGVCGVSGAAVLYMTQPAAALLSLANLLTYTLAYTPLKRISVYNTWIGAVVGGVPPLIGWAAANGDLLSINSGLLLAVILYGWQFPHFNALSWNLRKEYARAGYCMMSSYRPEMCKRVALRYSCLLAALPVMTSLCDVTHWLYAAASIPFNAYLLLLSWRFYRSANSHSARALTRYSYIYLLSCLVLLVSCHQLLTPTAAAADNSCSCRDKSVWRKLCVAQPLLEAGFSLDRLMAFAESYSNSDSDNSSGEATTVKTVK